MPHRGNISVIPFLASLALTYAQVPEVSPNGHVSIWYPVPDSNGSLLSFNAIDTLVMSYDTQWQAANASMWCLTTETDDADTDLYTGQDLDSPRSSTGNYIIHNLNSQIGATDFPLPCHFAFADPDNETDTYAGGSFIMVSTEGIASTWSLKEQQVTQASGSLVSTSTGGTAFSITASETTVSQTTQSSASSTSTSADPTGSDSASASAGTGPTSSSKGLSSGTVAAAVLVPILAVAAIIAGLAWWILRRRARARENGGSAPPTVESPSSESPTEVMSEIHGQHGRQVGELESIGAKDSAAELGTAPYWKSGLHEMAAAEVPTSVTGRRDMQNGEVRDSHDWASEQSDETLARQYR